MKRFLILGVMLLGFTACQRQPVQCTAESAQAPVVTIVKEQLEKLISGKVRKDDGARAVSLSKIRAAIAQLGITIDDIRTSKEDPNSTKRFCAGTLKIKFPADMLADAEKARAAAQMNTVDDLADASDVERNADRFSTVIEFNVQPTDDGSKVFAETESGNNLFGFTAEVLTSGLLRASVEDAQRQQQATLDQQKATEDAALAEQRAANVASARTDNQLAEQALTAIWRSLSPETRAQLLPQQRAWIRKKEADCRVEAASASTDPSEIEAARLACDTRAAQERQTWLQPYRNQDGGSPAPDG